MTLLFSSPQGTCYLLLDRLPIADAPKKISGVHKRCWKYIPSLAKSIGRKENSPKSTETAAKTEVQAA
ncbi:hypothetical protein OIU76_014782 [Salix suchowensis]|nr:hypothetical protein OIU76_014782 [Salix suchowensis]